MRAKLTPEDVEWLEQRLSAAMVPVTPRAEFIHHAKNALLGAALDEEDSKRLTWLPMVSFALIVISVVLLIAAILRRRAWRGATH